MDRDMRKWKGKECKGSSKERGTLYSVRLLVPNLRPRDLLVYM